MACVLGGVSSLLTLFCGPGSSGIMTRTVYSLSLLVYLQCGVIPAAFGGMGESSLKPPLQVLSLCPRRGLWSRAILFQTVW